MAVIRVIGAGALAALMAEERTHAPSETENMDRRRLAGRRTSEKSEREFEPSAPAGGTPAVHIAR